MKLSNFEFPAMPVLDKLYASQVTEITDETRKLLELELNRLEGALWEIQQQKEKYVNEIDSVRTSLRFLCRITLEYSYNLASFEQSVTELPAPMDWLEELNTDDTRFMYFIHKGNTAMINADLDALEYYSNAITECPDNCDGYYYRGNAYYDNQEYNKTVVDYTKVIELNPNYPNIFHNRALSYYYCGDFQSALSDYETQIQLGDVSPDIYVDKGDCHFEMQEWGKAIDAYNHGISLNHDLKSKVKTRLEHCQAQLY